jgi:DMSO/TMAO reductase YedYZ molybdopterin-dependent catalytic subunit
MLVSAGMAPSWLGAQSALLFGNAYASGAFQVPSTQHGAKELITSNQDFFVRNHFRTPHLSTDSWNLELTGLVTTPLKLSYADLLLMPSLRRVATVECAGNDSGGIGVGNAVWSGVTLADLLKQAGPKPVATTVVFHGADAGEGEGLAPNTHFARAIPMEKAQDPSTLVVYEMNGSPLPADHGFPLRALVGGWYGMDSVKWLTRIEVLSQPFDGYFQQKNYVAINGSGAQRPITRMLVSSKFLRPSEGEEIGVQTYRAEGVAWAGERKIVKVELRIGPGGSWQAASISDSAAAMTWTPWSFDWHIPRPGKYTLEVRAIDDEGRGQPDTRDPDRQDAYELNTSHRITVTAGS